MVLTSLHIYRLPGLKWDKWNILLWSYGSSVLGKSISLKANLLLWVKSLSLSSNSNTFWNPTVWLGVLKVWKGTSKRFFYPNFGILQFMVLISILKQICLKSDASLLLFLLKNTGGQWMSLAHGLISKKCNQYSMMNEGILNEMRNFFIYEFFTVIMRLQGSRWNTVQPVRKKNQLTTPAAAP